MGKAYHEDALSEVSYENESISSGASGCQNPANRLSTRIIGTQVLNGTGAVFANITLDVRDSKVKIEHADSVYFINAHLLETQFPDQDPVQFIANAVGRYERSTLQLFKLWLERGMLRPLHPHNKESAKSMLLKYVKLYNLASNNHIYALINTITDNSRARPTCGAGYFPINLIRKVYKITSAGSPLRRYLVDNFVFKTNRWSAQRRMELLRHHNGASEYNRQFVDDCDEKTTDNMLNRRVGQNPNH